MLCQLLPIKSTKNEKYYPVATRLGLIHFLPESQFDIATAMITDAGFFGLFLKSILKELQSHCREIESLNQDFATFDIFVEKLICAFIINHIIIF